MRCVFRALALRLRCSLWGVIRRWILGARLWVLPSSLEKVRLYVLTYLQGAVPFF